MGLAAAYQPSGRRVVAVIGDGAFQMGPQVKPSRASRGFGPGLCTETAVGASEVAVIGDGAFQMGPQAETIWSR